MSVLDDIRQAVAASEKLDAGVKSVVTEFLQTAGTALETLAPAVVQEILANFAKGSSSAATANISDAMTEEQVDSELGVVEQQMQSSLEQRATQVAAARQATAALQNAAISVLARLLISAL